MFSQEAQQSNMMDLEIADYERTVQSLNDAISERDSKLKDLEIEISRLEEKTASLQKQLGKTVALHNLNINDYLGK